MTQIQFKEIFSNHFEELRNYIYYKCGDTELATDIAQEAFVILWEKREKLRNDNLVGLLFKIARDLFISQYRKKSNEKNYSIQFQRNDSELSPEDQLQFEELNNKYETALNLMPEKQRLVFLMSRMEQLKYQEIAERMDVGIKAVEKNMSKALSYLRNALNYKK